MDSVLKLHGLELNGYGDHRVSDEVYAAIIAIMEVRAPHMVGAFREQAADKYNVTPTECALLIARETKDRAELLLRYPMRFPTDIRWMILCYFIEIEKGKVTFCGLVHSFGDYPAMESGNWRWWYNLDHMKRDAFASDPLPTHEQCRAALRAIM